MLKEILREYEAYRLEQYNMLKQREAEVLAALPELAGLRQSLVSSWPRKPVP